MIYYRYRKFSTKCPVFGCTNIKNSKFICYFCSTGSWELTFFCKEHTESKYKHVCYLLGCREKLKIFPELDFEYIVGE